MASFLCVAWGASPIPLLGGTPPAGSGSGLGLLFHVFVRRQVRIVHIVLPASGGQSSVACADSSKEPFSYTFSLRGMGRKSHTFLGGTPPAGGGAGLDLLLHVFVRQQVRIVHIVLPASADNPQSAAPTLSVACGDSSPKGALLSAPFFRTWCEASFPIGL
jgi:hypothetical protein